MNKSGEEILADIDHTLDQLIRNAHMLKQVSEQEAFASYSARMHKTQTSLAARILHMEDLLLESSIKPEETSPLYETIQDKIVQYKKLNNRMLSLLSSRFKKAQGSNKPRIGKNRKLVQR
ncbi:MAG: hypothetical protein KGZ39_02555 [Simkania sp.]|nr:hypothetical protein [Simkania sp.]